MNIVLWIIQGILALLCLAGGSYKMLKPGEVALQMRALPNGAWRALGLLELACGVLLVVPLAANWMPFLTPVAAVVLAVECFGVAGLAARLSLRVSAANPLVWSAAMGVMAVLVALGRHGAIAS
jgi:hypothetical protein